jgi:diguanylate cyclase (GGDEF)-like protein/PAS domain S-box-containing protein
MNPPDILPTVLTLCGAALLTLSIPRIFSLIRENPASAPKWKGFLFLITSFLVLEAIYVIGLQGKPVTLVSVLVGLVFLGGGWFVQAMVRLMAQTVAVVRQANAEKVEARSDALRLATILDNTTEGIITFDGEGRIESINASASRLFGYTQQELAGQDVTVLLQPVEERDRREGYLAHFMRSEINRLVGHEGELTGRHKDGVMFPLSIKTGKMIVDGKQMYTALLSDISERKELMNHLQYMAERDGLTGLFNRSYFQAELERLVERVCRNQNQCCALLYIDLDNFKYVNDTLGHAAGDFLLIEVSGLLNKRARKSDIIARIGGDEFTVLLYNTTAQLAHQAAESFRKQITEHVFSFKAERVDIGCSIGVSVLTPETRTSAEALSRADLACHLAKRSGRNRVHLFDPEDEADMTTMSLDIGWSSRIKDAISKGNFALACQPIVNTATREIECYEVLIRMLDENNQMVMPGGFLPSAERFGLAPEIDKWVIINAIETLALQRSTKPNLRYAINLSGQTLSDPTVGDLIANALNANSLDPSALTFEVTETVAIADMGQAESFLSRLQELGCRTALDDFGSGFSSFAYLKDLPVDEVKLDGRFVRGIANNPVDQAMVKAMNEIVHAMGKRTVAEFVETEEALQILAHYGVDYVQGYHLGRPDYVLPCRAIAEHAGGNVLCRL